MKYTKITNKNITDNFLLNLLKEREKMYSGDEETINKIIEIYGKEIKSYMER